MVGISARSYLRNGRGMSWKNHRIFRHREKVGPAEWKDHYTLNETYYDDKGKVINYTGPIEPYGETVEELIEHIEQMLKDAKRSKKDVWDYLE